MKKAQAGPQIAAIVIVAVIVLVVVASFFIGKWGVDNKPPPAVYAASSWCNPDEFKAEYNITSLFDKSLVYDGETYYILQNWPTGLPILVRGSTCSLEQKEAYANDVFTYSELQIYLASKDLSIYRDLATCYGVSAGARPICGATTTINNIVSNPGVKTAADNEGATLSLVNSLAPSGWKKESVDTSRNIIRLTKEIEGPGIVSLAFDVADTTSCFLKDSRAVFIYDYSLTVGDDLWYKIKNKNSYTGMDNDITTINKGLLSLMSQPDAQSTISNVAATFLGGKGCDLDAKGKYGPELESINNAITSSRSYGDSVGSQYIDWFKGLSNNASAIRAEILNNTQPGSMYTLGGTVKALFFITKIGDYLDARKHFESAESFYARGLFYSAEREYNALAISKAKADDKNWIDYVIAFAFWTILIVLIIIAAAFLVRG